MSVDMISRFFFRKDLTTHEIAIGIAMADWTDQIGRCWAAVGTLAEKVNCSDRSVQKALRRFVDLGIIRIQERQDQTSVYYLLTDGLPHTERTRRRKESAPGETGERRARTGEPRSPHEAGTGEPHSPTGEPRSPRYVSDTLDSPSPSSKGSPLDEKNLFGEAVKTAEQIQAEADSELIEFVMDRWKALVASNSGIPSVRGPLSDARRKEIIVRADRQGWTDVFEQIDQSRFLRGLTKPGRDRDEPMLIKFDWLLKPRNFAKVLEGNYRDNRALSPGFDAQSGRTLTAVEQASRNVASRIREGRERRGFGGDRGGAQAGTPRLADQRAGSD